MLTATTACEERTFMAEAPAGFLPDALAGRQADTGSR